MVSYPILGSTATNVPLLLAPPLLEGCDVRTGWSARKLLELRSQLLRVNEPVEVGVSDREEVEAEEGGEVEARPHRLLLLPEERVSRHYLHQRGTLRLSLIVDRLEHAGPADQFGLHLLPLHLHEPSHPQLHARHPSQLVAQLRPQQHLPHGREDDEEEADEGALGGSWAHDPHHVGHLLLHLGDRADEAGQPCEAEHAEDRDSALAALALVGGGGGAEAVDGVPALRDVDDGDADGEEVEAVEAVPEVGEGGPRPEELLPPDGVGAHPHELDEHLGGEPDGAGEVADLEDEEKRHEVSLRAVEAPDKRLSVRVEEH
eukprot:156270-Hanusia_phi.AAC.1